MAHKKGKKKKPSKAKSSRKPSVEGRGLRNLKYLLMAVAVPITCLCLLYVLQLPRAGDIKEVSSEEKTDSEFRQSLSIRKVNAQEHVKKNSSEAASRIFEEAADHKLYKAINDIEMAILDSLEAIKKQTANIRHKNFYLRHAGGCSYYFQSLVLKLDSKDQEPFVQNLRSHLNSLSPSYELEALRHLPGTWEVRFCGLPTHHLVLRSAPSKLSVQQKVPQPKMAIVIDDLGENMHQAKRLIEAFQDRITLSVLPNCTHTREIASLAVKKGLDLLLHLPMEPLGYPEVDPGPGTLFVGMDDIKIASVLARDIQQIPGLIGVNNHMGSRFTSHQDSMQVVLKELKKRDLFFMDSLTNSQSVVRDLADELGMSVISRDIFIDNEQHLEAIMFQLQKAEQVAKHHGQAIAVGHPYPETIEALIKWLKVRDKEVRLCKLSKLLNEDR